jgi:hypothetical protein
VGSACHPHDPNLYKFPPNLPLPPAAHFLPPAASSLAPRRHATKEEGSNEATEDAGETSSLLDCFIACLLEERVY